MKADKILDVIRNLGLSEYRKILINGAWGIGKTKYSNDYIAENNESTIYISLFGKKSIDIITNELYFKVIEKSDRKIVKKWKQKITNRIKNINFSFVGLSVTLPLVNNLLSSLQSEIGKQQTFTIIIDDIERKHNDLQMNEIFGLVDNLSIINNLKIVMIASKSNMSDVDKEDLKKYKEKAIDREYLVSDFSDDAPKSILGDSNWTILCNIIGELNFKNLRVFEKTYSFLNEVERILGTDIYNDNLTRNDVVKICFSIVFYIEEYSGEKTLLNPKNTVVNAYYKEGDSEYINNYILKGSLDNGTTKKIFPYILDWYKRGEVALEDLKSTINFIRDFEEEPHNFYSSENDIIKIIDNAFNKINDNATNYSLLDLLRELDIALIWCELLEYPFELTHEEIIEKLKKVAQMNIDINQTIYENKIDSFMAAINSKQMLIIVKDLNEFISKEYYNKVLSGLKNSIRDKEYSKYGLFKLLDLEIHVPVNKDDMRKMLISEFSDNAYFFPLPKGKIGYNQWMWCANINDLCKKIGEHSTGKLFYEEYNTFLDEQVLISKDRMLSHRIRELRKN